MSDKLFFPLAAVVASAFIFVALDPFADRPPRGPVSGGGRNAEDITVEGRELHRMLPGDAGGLSIDNGAQPIAHISRLVEQAYQHPQSGPHVILAEDVEYAFENRTIEVTVVARSAGAFPADKIEVDYAAKADEESGWRQCPLTSDFTPCTFRWHTPARGVAQGYDYLGIRPVVPDKRRTMEVQSIRIHAVSPKDGAPKDAPK